MSRAGQPLKANKTARSCTLYIYSGVGYLCDCGEWGIISCADKGKSVTSGGKFQFCLCGGEANRGMEPGAVAWGEMQLFAAAE